MTTYYAKATFAPTWTLGQTYVEGRLVAASFEDRRSLVERADDVRYEIRRNITDGETACWLTQ